MDSALLINDKAIMLSPEPNIPLSYIPPILSYAFFVIAQAYPGCQ